MTSPGHLDDSLQALRSEIQALDSVDAESRARLERLVADLGTNLGRPGGGSGDGIAERLRSSIVSFETSHPRLAVVMNDVLEKLSAMGV